MQHLSNSAIEAAPPTPDAFLHASRGVSGVLHK